MRTNRFFVIISLAGGLALGGCATSAQLDQKIAEAEARSEQKIESVEQQVEQLQQRQRQTEENLAQVSQEASEALRRANEAGLLAKGQVVFEETFTEDRVRFQLESAQLSAEAQSSLDEFGRRVKALDRSYFIEIQGHTDSTGSEAYNERLGQQRAESVRRHLSRQHGLPLARMSTISYGETLPAADNGTPAGRSQNRRVVLVVLE